MFHSILETKIIRVGKKDIGKMEKNQKVQSVKNMLGLRATLCVSVCVFRLYLRIIVRGRKSDI